MNISLIQFTLRPYCGRGLRYVEVVVPVLWEVSEKLHKEVVVVQSCLVVINVVVHRRIVRVGEPNTNWGLHWNKK